MMPARSAEAVHCEFASRRVVERSVSTLRITCVSATVHIVAIDRYPSFRLPADLAVLLDVLSENAGRRPEPCDPLVGFKSKAFLLHRLGARLGRLITRPILARWTRRLRAELARHIDGGAGLIEKTRAEGVRLRRLR
jgi:hypothetical protein